LRRGKLSLALHNACGRLTAAAPSPTLPRKREREKNACAARLPNYNSAAMIASRSASSAVVATGLPTWRYQ
jgi:hypothetical protein